MTAKNLIGVVQNLVVENRVVKSKTKKNGDGGGKIGILASLHRLLVATSHLRR